MRARRSLRRLAAVLVAGLSVAGLAPAVRPAGASAPSGPTLTLSQDADSRVHGETHTVTATATAADGTPVPDGTIVTFQIDQTTPWSLTVGSPAVELSSLPFSSPSIPALIGAGLASDLPVQTSRGKDDVASALRREPVSGVMHPPGSRLDQASHLLRLHIAFRLQLVIDVQRKAGPLDLQAGQGTAGKLLKDPAMYEDFRQTTADIRRLINVDLHKIVDDLNAGRGTAGKLLKDDEMYRRIDQLVANLTTSVDKLNAGQGTLGQLLVNAQLYDSLNGATREAQSLLKDIRANPKKFLRIKLGIF